MTLAPDLPRHTKSWLARRDPRWRLAAISLWSVAASLVNSLDASLVAFCGSVVVLASVQLPWHWLKRRLLSIIPFVLLIFVPTLAWQGKSALLPSAILLFKMLSVLISTMILFGLTSSIEFLDSLRALRLPGPLISLLQLAERYGVVLSMNFNRTRRALCVRGFKWQSNRHTYRTVGNALGSLVVRSSIRAECVGHALACRGFDGQYRSWRSYQTTIGDITLFTGAVVVSVALVRWDWQLAS